MATYRVTYRNSVGLHTYQLVADTKTAARAQFRAQASTARIVEIEPVSDAELPDPCRFCPGHGLPALPADPEPTEGEQAAALPERMATFPRDGYTRLIYAAREDADTVAEHYRALGARVETPDVWTVDVYGPDIDDTAAWQEWARDRRADLIDQWAQDLIADEQSQPTRTGDDEIVYAGDDGQEP